MIQGFRFKKHILKTVFLVLYVGFNFQCLFSHDVEFEDISKDSTLDVVTWNVEWFGDSDFGPADLDLQLTNVVNVVETIDADLYVLQEISSKPRFFALVDSLEGYSGFFANSSQSLKTAYLFKPTVIDSLDSELLESMQNEAKWASGRFPPFLEFDVHLAGKELRVFSYNLHVKAQADQNSYNQRYNAARSLKQYLDEFRFNASGIVLGDFNDQLTKLTFGDEPSPYEPFVKDDSYFTVTKALEEEGEASYPAEEFRSIIDHVITTNVPKNIHIDGGLRVGDTSYIKDFVTKTSDHAPVWTRYDFIRSFEDEFVELPDGFSVAPNYPNPFNPSTTIQFSLSAPTDVTITVFDILGRQISVLLDNRDFQPCEHTV